MSPVSAADPSVIRFPQARANERAYPTDLDLHLMNSAEYLGHFGAFIGQ